MRNYKILTEVELNKIHGSTLDIMKNLGVKFTLKEALAIFSDAGFFVSKDGIVKFKPEQVEKYIKKVPSRFVRKGIDSKYDCDFGSDSLYMGGGSLPIHIIDSDTYERRKPTIQDMVKFTKLVDALDNFYIGNSVVQPAEIPHNVMHAVWDQNAACNMSKPSCCWYALDKQTAQDTIQILSAASGGTDKLKKNKTWATTICPDSALIWGRSIWGILEGAKVEIPLEILPMPFCGSTHPVTIAGALVQANAETLSAVILAQIIKPGCPIIYAPSYGGIMDMAVGSHSFGTPETALYGAAAAQLGKWYKFPTNIMMGTTDSKAPDAQASYEKMMTFILPALAGCDCMSLTGGMLDFALSANYEQTVIDNEIAGQVLRLRKGFEINEDTLAVDVIKEVGHDGTYLPTEHTFRHFKDELWFPKLADRTPYTTWSSKGKKDILKRAKEKVEEILKTHKAKGIDNNKKEEVNRIVKEIFKREKVDYKKYNLERYMCE
ncbi:MAG: trimethylamine methyltransferase family protein [bacterium]